MKLSVKMYLLILLALSIGLLLLRSSEMTTHTLESNAEALGYFHQLSELQHRLDKQALRSAYLLYHDYDEMDIILEEIDTVVSRLKTASFYERESYIEIRKQIDSYEASLLQIRTNIQRFQTLNAIIKNSSTHIPTLGNRFMQTTNGSTHFSYYIQLSNIISNVFLSKHSLDSDFLFDVHDSLELLDGLAVEYQDIQDFNNIFRAHVQVFTENFPQYTQYLDNIIHSDTEQIVARMAADFSKISHNEADTIQSLSFILSIAFGIAFIYIAWMLIAREFQNKRLTRLQQDLHKEAYFDRITRLKSRLAFQRELAINETYALILLDIDGFKNINDFYGNDVGDDVLRHVAQQITEVNKIQLVSFEAYRLSADEFAILVPDCNDESVNKIAESVLDKLEQNIFEYNGIEVPLNMSVGIAMEQPLLEKADLALKHIKGKRSSILHYDSQQELESEAESNLKTLNHLRSAIDNDGVTPWFQPIVHNRSGTIKHFECLARIEIDETLTLYPNEFLDVAKQARLYATITQIMLDKCFEAFAENDFSFSVNLSVDDLLDPMIVSHILSLLHQHPQTGSRLIIELLESEAVTDYGRVTENLDKFREYNCRIAIDDFGTGYSSLEHLLRIHPDIVKIDGSLIRNIDRDIDTYSFIRAITHTLSEIGIEHVIAEYVHSQNIQKIICELEISYSQGYYIGKPLDNLDLVNTEGFPLMDKSIPC